MSAHKFSSKRTLWLTITFLVMGASALVAWGGGQILALQIPFEAEWASSGHADVTAEAFTLSSEICVFCTESTETVLHYQIDFVQ